MKKLETIANETTKMLESENLFDEFLTQITCEDAHEYFSDEDVFKKEISQNDIFSMMIFRELNKALSNKSYQMILDANYSKSKMHNNCKYLVNYYSLLNSSNDRAIQFYTTANLKNKSVHFRLCTSCKKVTREQFETLQDSLHFTVKRDKKTNRAKTSERKNVQYDELVSVVKTVLAVLNNEYQTEKESE